MTATKKTVLYSWHKDRGANISHFGGYEMPLWYPAGAKAEHLAVIQAAGLFDTSHMAVLQLEGEASYQLLQTAFSKDLSKCIGRDKKPLASGRCVYGLFLDERGYVIDDAIVCQRADDSFMVVVNDGMGGAVASHLFSFDESRGVTLFDHTDRLGKLDIQGIATLKVLEELLENAQEVLTGLLYFSFKGWFEASGSVPSVRTRSGIEILLSRTGYTGEFGVEIFAAQDQTEQLWHEILTCGAASGILPCGLAARDSLRTGAVLPLSQQDIGQWIFGNTPWDFVLPLDNAGAFTKSFHGDAALKKRDDIFTYPFAGYDPRKIVPDEQAFVADETGTKVGRILTCTTDMAIGRTPEDRIQSISEKSEDKVVFEPKGLSCGFIQTEQTFSTGDILYLVSGRRKIKIEVRDDIRPARTARMSIDKIRQLYN